MKSEKAVVAMMEKAVDGLAALTNSIPEGTDPASIPDEKKQECLYRVATIVTLGIVLDMEDEVNKAILIPLKMAHMAEKMKTLV